MRSGTGDRIRPGASAPSNESQGKDPPPVLAPGEVRPAGPAKPALQKLVPGLQAHRPRVLESGAGCGSDLPPGEAGLRSKGLLRGRLRPGGTSPALLARGLVP